MRHARKINSLSRTSSHRKAMMANMANALLRHKRIHTTVAKAKALRKYVEPLITRAKEDTTHSRRVVFSYLRDKEVITELYTVISNKIGERPGGYTRIIRLGTRKGDAAEQCMMELVDFNPWMTKELPKAKRSRRRRSGSTKKTAVAPSPDVTTEATDASTPTSDNATEALDASTSTSDNATEALDASTSTSDNATEALDASTSTSDNATEALDASTSTSDTTTEAMDTSTSTSDNATEAMDSETSSSATDPSVPLDTDEQNDDKHDKTP